MTVSNDKLIQAVFSATDEAKSRALEILEGRDSPPGCPQEPEEAPLLLGMGDSAKLLGVSRATLWRMIRDGRLEKVEIYHNAYRLRRSDILDLVNERTARGAGIPACASPRSMPHAPCAEPEARHG